ncbi:class I SAM-dependent methyltransferase [Thermosynechococcus sp. PP42]|uniref:class I SAM-dependent methyltransferase n=1 Tax=Thermosynechococcus sp. PP42 TaxID=3074083 RepID=UPI002863A775|nr:class I SAM-dependent methyltransferase [Thermosynechococcus sp. PP42]MDR5638516.1 class I SAM-dependent methyltransferase [Thermosynechococcus sp. PP42]
MEQEKIWDYFQNHDDLSRIVFPESRQLFFLRYLQAGTRVLNIGVGSGALERLGLGKGVEMYSLDPSEKAIVRMQQILGMTDRARVGYAQNVPFDSDFFDVVVMSEVLEHLSDDILVCSLKEVFRVLRVGGVLLASTPYREDLQASQVVCPSCGAVFHKVGHIQSFDKNRMRKLLQAAGFDVEKIWVTTFVDWQRKGFRNFIKSVIRVALARMGEGIADPHLLVRARKPKR